MSDPKKSETMMDEGDMRPERLRVAPARRLLAVGIALVAISIVVSVVLSFWVMIEVEPRLSRVAEIRQTSDSVHGIQLATRELDRAMNQWEMGFAEDARAGRVRASEQFQAHAGRLHSSELVEQMELTTISTLFAELEQMAIQELGTPIGEYMHQEGEHPRLVALEYDLDLRIERLNHHMELLLDEEWNDVRSVLKKGLPKVVALGSILLLLSVSTGIFLTWRILKGLDRPIRQISLSTRQLAGAAQYQVASAAEHASAAVQISTTMQELVATSRNMSENSRHMVQTSKDAADECHKGHALLSHSQKGMGEIKGQVGRVTDHMNSLVEKAQQINSVLEIINEMASQTNLLSINATIEAAGAGEAGRRFAVVAEEIRMLAERAVESTEEIRALIEDIQETARVTSEATVGGVNAVEQGIEDTARIAENFDALLMLVTKTADSIQEIEMTAREQRVAVEQVTEAVESLSQVSGESEKKSSETLETVENLSRTAMELEFMAGGNIREEV
ncbi:MAG: methyl-accepting chemotaxis protein [Leptospirillia bacterium]